MTTTGPLYRRHLQIRCGGDVKRFHTFPTLGEQKISSHTWGVMAILMDICDNGGPSAQLLKVALYHDVAEYHTGDVPSTAKRNSPALKAALDDLEDHHAHRMGLDMHLDEEDKRLLKVADLLEMLFFVLDQRFLGNRCYDVVFHRVSKWLRAQPYLTISAQSLLNDLNTHYQELSHGRYDYATE